MELAGGLGAAIDAARAVGARFTTCSDDELVADGAAIEALGRLVDGMRVGFAAEAERRSDLKLGEDRLAFRRGARDGVELVQRTARVGHREARQRVGLGAKLAPVVSIFAEPLPGRHPAVAEAVTEGRIGLDSARAITGAVDEIRPRVAEADLVRMTDALIEAAESTDTEDVRDLAAAWSLILDPDGAEPREREQRRKRSLKLGRTLADGTTRLTMILTAEDLAFIRELLASRRRGVPMTRTEAGGDDDPDGDGPEWRAEGDDRSRAQADHDTAMDALRAGATATEPAVALHETVVTITAAEVEGRRGQGFTAGILAGIPLPVIERQVCTGGVRLTVLSPGGEVLHHGRTRRIFSPAQRRSLSVTAGGRCQYPGCRVPEPYLEAHHVEWWHRDGGCTDIGNGIMLCSFHHHLIHAQHSPVRIVRYDGAHHIVPASWLGPPLPRHRVRTGAPLSRPAAA